METNVHIAVATAPEGGLTLEHDIRLVKAAVLYADRVTLCSPTSSMLLAALSIGHLADEDRLRFVASLAPLLAPDRAASFIAVAETFSRLNRARRRTSQELIALAKIKRGLKDTWDALRPSLQSIAEKAGADELVRAVEAGLVELHAFHNYDERLIGEFVEFLRATLADRQRYPLLDEQIGRLVNSGTAEGMFSPSRPGVARGRHAALAADLLARLPLLERATFDEIVDIRRELEGPLVRFRAAIQTFSESIEAAPWDADFAADAEAVFVREVAPAVAEIAEAMATNLYLTKLVDRAVSSGAAVGAFGVLIANAVDAPAILQVAAGAAASVTGAAWDAYRDWESRREEIERNHMFFYYRAETGLSE